MKPRYYLEGLLGLLSLLGFVGVFSEERMFLAFFAFACNFQYFFITADEMMTAYMNRAAARAFYADMLLTGAVTAGGILAGLPAGRASTSTSGPSTRASPMRRPGTSRAWAK